MSNQETIGYAWKAYQKNLITFIRSKVATLEDAEDILNEVFEALIKKANNDEMPDNITSWLYKVTKNKIVDYYRTKKSYAELPEDLVSESENVSAMEQLSHCLVPMIMTLPENYQQPLILSEIEGKRYKDLARELNLSISAVKSRIIRGREKLYKSMVACCSIERDMAGNVMDYHLNDKDSCTGCGD